ncbi:MAG: 4Fe-4S dicluster domain-containing protein [Candidatus Thorarchaeota archaeon]|nr:MAG: 4Fe-4S dicluster domain-containing protein [Candidatus Thorarchaeota archaeon]
MKSILSIDVNTCTGCRNCEIACSVFHTKSFNPARSLMRILKDETRALIMPMVCLQCEDPLCKAACPTDAIVENKDGILYVERDECIGCMNCVTACIYGGIEIDPLNKKAAKCDLCWGDPACVKACDYRAIAVIEATAEGLRQRKQGIEVLAHLYDHESQEA